MKKHLLLLTIATLPLFCQAQGWPDNYGGVMLQAFSWNSFGDTKWKNLTTTFMDIRCLFKESFLYFSRYCRNL